VRLGQTHLGRLAALGSLLAEAYIEPGGIAVIGAELPGARSEYSYEYTGSFARSGGPHRLEESDVVSEPPARGRAAGTRRRSQARSQRD
jgi:hypothetical protein